MPAEERVSHEVVVVVSGGEQLPPAAPTLPADAPVVAADRGLEHALARGLDVSVAVGDFDSVSPDALDAAESSGVRVVRHSPEKDSTDLELALDVALTFAPDRILVLAGRGGRLDHELSALLLLASDRYEAVEVDALIGEARIHVVRGERVLDGEPGELVTLLAAHGPAFGVTTEGLSFPLRGETLAAGSSRGVSNAFVAHTARVALSSGVLLAVRPGADRERGLL
jgi:thiamine pyrophosphokinase